MASAVGNITGPIFGSVARHLSVEGQAEDKQALSDIDALKRNEFGPSRAQKEQQTADAVALARSQAQAQRSEAARQGAASKFGTADLSGQKIAETAERTAGSTRMAVEGQAAQQARQLKLDALGRITKRAQATEDAATKVGEGVGDLGYSAITGTPPPSAVGAQDEYGGMAKKNADKAAAEKLNGLVTGGTK